MPEFLTCSKRPEFCKRACALNNYDQDVSELTKLRFHLESIDVLKCTNVLPNILRIKHNDFGGMMLLKITLQIVPS